MLVCGVDLGTRKSAVARLYMHDEPDHSLNPLLSDAVSLMVHPASRAHELLLLSEMTALACTGASYVFIEEPLVGRGVKASMNISQTAGAVMAQLASIGVSTELVNVQHWKKEVIGMGNASKKDIEMWLSATHPVYSAECDDQDQRDATCIALYGWQTLRSVEAGVFRDEVTDPRPVLGVEPP